MAEGYRMAIGADRGAVGRATAAFADFAESHALPAEVRRSITVVLDELLANALTHGAAGRRGAEVLLEVALTPGRLTVTVQDDGRAFDPLRREAPDTTLPVEQRPIGGLGIHLVRRLVDEAQYERRDDRNVVTLVKHLAGTDTGRHQGGR